MIILIVMLLCAMCVLLGFFALARNSRSNINRVYAYFAFAVSVWMMANFFGSNYKDYSISVQLIHLDFLVGSFIPYLYFVLARSASGGSSRGILPVGKLPLTIFILACTASLFTLFEPFVGIYFIDGRTVIEYGPLYFIYGLMLLTQIIIATSIIYRAYKKAVGIQRARLSNLLFVTFIMLIIGFISNLVTPLISDSEDINLMMGNSAYIGITLFVVFSFYSIIKGRLLDVRLATARVVGYGISVALVVAVTALSAVEGFRRLSGVDLGLLDVAMLALFVVIVSSLFNRLRRFFSKVANGVFRTNFYSIDDAILGINQKFVEEVSVHAIAQKSLHELNQYINAEYLAIVTYLETTPEIISLNSSVKINDEDLEHIRELTRVSGFWNGGKDEYVQSKGIDAVVILAKPASGVDGYLIVGHKSNGELYSKTDIQLVTIFANNLSLALANALNVKKVILFNDALKIEVDQATKKLIQTNSRLKTINKSKDEMISMAAHQIRPQLTALRGFLDLLSQKERNETKVEMLNWSATGIERIIRIVTDMLNLSRVTSGEFKISPSKVDLVSMIKNELLSVEPLRRTRKTKIILNPLPRKALIQADEVKLREVIANLLTNAIEYSPAQKGKVEVILSSVGEGYEISVQDNGIGVDQSEEANLFRKYYRTAKAAEVRPAGTGVGLFLAKKVIEAHSGKVFYRRSTKGQGSVFGFWLPVAEPSKKS